MNARALDPLLGRFISADTIVPSPADPQSLNRYAMTINNPLKYTDPTGHDLMLVHGYYQSCNDDYLTAVKSWSNWIRAYKGWSETYFEEFLDRHPTEQALEDGLRDVGVRIFRYRNHDQAAPLTDQDVQDLGNQMSGMKDITLVGHSKGANLVMNYIAANEFSLVKKFVINKAHGLAVSHFTYQVPKLQVGRLASIHSIVVIGCVCRVKQP